MRELKKAFEAKHPGVTINLTAGLSKQLAGRILKGDPWSVFAPSSPAVIDEDLMHKRIAGSGAEAASWYVVFSGNEMVIITAPGNPLEIRGATDLSRPGVRFARATGEKDRATGRTIEFLKRATSLEGQPELAQKIVDGAVGEAGKATSVPDTVNVGFLLSPEAQGILRETGQPPVVPAIRKGAVPAEVE